MPYVVASMVEVCVFKFERDQVLFLLLKRRKDEKLYPGIWQYITGSIEEKEKAADAAIRELKEETGFSPQNFWVVPHVNAFYDPDYDSMNLLALFAAQVRPGEEPLLSSEHEEFLWLPLNEALNKLVWPGQREGLRIVQDHIINGQKASTLNRIL